MKYLLLLISLLIFNTCESQEKRQKYINAETVYIEGIPLTKFENYIFVKDSLKHIFNTNITLNTGKYDEDNADFIGADEYVNIKLNGLSVWFNFQKNNSYAFLESVDITDAIYSLVYKRKKVRVGDSYEKLKVLFPKRFNSFINEYKEEIFKGRELVLGITTYNPSNYDPSINFPYWMNLNFGIKKGKIAWISLINE